VSIIHRPINWEDQRGVIRDIFPTGSPESVTLITSARGAVRGNHYHKISSQYAFVVSGRMLAFSRSEGDIGDVARHEMGPGDMILHRPGEAHAYLAIEDTIFLAFADGLRRGGDYEKDTYRVPPLFDPEAELAGAERG
jgi:quercetin dioxygenase-like cupin family protein